MTQLCCLSSVVFVLGTLSGHSAFAADLVSELASLLHTQPEWLVLNLPPRPGAWPGAIFSYDMRLPIVEGVGDDPKLRRGDPTSIAVNSHISLGANVNAGWLTLFKVAAQAEDKADVKMSFENLVVIDISESELERRANDSIPVKLAAKEGRIPQVIYKAYEAVPTLILTRHKDASAEVWAKVPAGKIDGSVAIGAETGEVIEYRTKKTIVFAYEVMQAGFLIRK